jgi:hypothetical protein
LPSLKEVRNFLTVHCPNGLLKATLIIHFNHQGFPGFKARIAPAVSPSSSSNIGNVFLLNNVLSSSIELFFNCSIITFASLTEYP